MVTHVPLLSYFAHYLWSSKTQTSWGKKVPQVRKVWTQRKDQGRVQGPQRKYILRACSSATLLELTYSRDSLTCPSQGKQPCTYDLTHDCRQYQSYLTDLRTVPSLDFKRRAFIKSSKVIDLEEQDLIPLTSVVSKGFKVPLDVGVSPFIIPDHDSFLINFDTPMGSTP